MVPLRGVELPCMGRIELLHWNAEEAQQYLEFLRRAGHEAGYEAEFSPALMRRWRESPPDAFVIDLSRLPSHGREIGSALRQSRATRHVPLVFCEGAPEKVARVRTELPDATYCTRRTLRSSLKRAMQGQPETPVVPREMMKRYAGRTAAEKLGIREGATVKAIDAPRDFPDLLGSLPKGVELADFRVKDPQITLCFAQNADGLRRRFSEIRRYADGLKLWVLWRKGGSAGRGDITEQLVRETGIELGFVDYKICSVNEVWSGLAFARKR